MHPVLLVSDEETIEFPSVKACAEHLNKPPVTISDAIRNHRLVKRKYKIVYKNAQQ